MLMLLAYGAAAALSLDPTVIHDLGSLAPSFRLPALHVPPVSWQEVITGALVLAVPQMALTLGNAVIATAEEHNALFPHRRISVRLLALDQIGALFFADSVRTVFRLCPVPVLGLILFFAGIELAIGLNGDACSRCRHGWPAGSVTSRASSATWPSGR